MTPFQLVVLSLTQGITEFLPVSSDGHLNLLQHLLGLTPSLTFDIFLNTATLVSVLFYFRRQVPYFFKNLGYIVVGTLPAALVGILFKDQVEIIAAKPSLLPLFFFVTSLMVLSTRNLLRHSQPLTFTKALIIGVFQSLAILPGVSRSACTIFAGLLLGLSTTESFWFSFSLFIPASFGAILLDSEKLNQLSVLQPGLILSFVLTALVGYVALFVLQRTLRSSKYWYFGLYTLFLVLLLSFS